MRAQDNSHLTAQARKTLTRQQNQESRRIHRDTHKQVALSPSPKEKAARYSGGLSCSINEISTCSAPPCTALPQEHSGRLPVWSKG